MSQSVPGGYFAFKNGPDDYKPMQGTLVTLAFVWIWFLSMVIPLVLIFCVYNRFDGLAGVIVLVVSFCYAPWPQSQFVKRMCRQGGRGYFQNISLYFEEPFLGEQGCASKLLCVHPHGVICMGWMVLFNSPELNEVDFCFSTVLLLAPMFRLLVKTVGRPQSVHRDNFKALMRLGGPMALIPGGFEEATLSSTRINRVYLRKRLGFVKYALQFGYNLVPCYIFGENTTFSNSQGCWQVRFALNYLGLPAVVPWGRWWCLLMPRNKKLHVVVGKALELPRIQTPTSKEISKYHAEYCKVLVDLFDRNKGSYGEANSKLEVW